MTIELGTNLTAVLIALIAAIPAIIAAFYARRANNTSTATHIAVNGRLGEMLQAKDDLIIASQKAEAFAQGVAVPTAPVVIPTVIPTVTPDNSGK